MPTLRPPRIGLVLGSGSARGWSHIGVIRALERAGIVPDVVCGTSIGSLVGAIYVAGRLDWLQDWVTRLNWQGVVSLLDLTLNGGLIGGSRLVDFFRTRFDDEGIEHLPRAFGCVATELGTGREVWLREGPVIDAVRASIALPGLFAPARQPDGRLLVDGGLVNPVPVSLCRAMGAEFVIAVDLNWDLIGRRHHTTSAQTQAASPAVPPVAPPAAQPISGLVASLLAKWGARGAEPGAATPAGPTPSMLDVMTTSLNIMQVRITQSRLAGEPADVVIRPRLADVAAMDFHRGALAIAEGERATEAALPGLHELLG